MLALIITIIVLVILAGVAISTLSGNDGILKKGNEVVGKYNGEAKNEQDLLNQYANTIEEELILEYWEGEVNKPNIKEEMITVKWNGTDWVKADVANTGHDWYNYNETDKKWANVVTVKENGTKVHPAFASDTDMGE